MNEPTALERPTAIVTVTLNTAIDRVIEVPGLALGMHLRGRMLARRPAGKAFNISRVLARLGVPSVATGFVGRTEVSGFEAAESEHLHAQFLTIDGPTRQNLTLIDPEHSTETHIRTDGYEVTARDLDRLTRKLRLLAKPGVLVVFGGSLPGGMETERFVGLVDKVIAAGAAAAVDAEGDALRSVVDRPLWAVKPNRQELAAIAEEPPDTEEALIRAGRRLGEQARVVIVTCGAAGAYAFHQGAVLLGQVAVDAARVVSTVGCGDAMLAGFIAAQHRGADVRESFAEALAVATAMATSPVPGVFAEDQVGAHWASTSVIALAEERSRPGA